MFPQQESNLPDTTQQQELAGVVERVLFQDPTSGYTVLVLTLSPHETVTVTCHLSAINAGEHITATGKWITHPKFGKQFETSSCSITLPTSKVGLEKYLGSGLIKGIGKTYAKKMVAAFGEQILEVIDKQPHRLQSIDGIGPSRIEKIVAAWQQHKEISNIMVFLQDKGISLTYATKIYKKYGTRVVSVLQENPYRLAQEIWGIGFKMADRVAQNMGFELTSIKRIKAGIIFALQTAIGSGHLYAEISEVKAKALELLELEGNEQEVKLKTALHQLHDEGAIKVISEESAHFITLSMYYFAERGIAQRLRTLLEQHSKNVFDLDKIYQTLRVPSTHEIELNEDQQRGIMTCLQQKITVITGGPGTGKTTLIKKLLDLLDTHKAVYKLAAPTGRAAKRMMEGTKRHALTLHRLLEFDASTMSFGHNENNALKLDFLIVDEASMIDVFLAHALLKAVPFHAHIIFLGDIDQLPSVGAGNFLHDLIQSNRATTVRLTHIFRQAHNSLIVLNAHRVNAGEFPVSSAEDAKKDFFFIKENDPLQMRQHLQKIFQFTLRASGITPLDSMVLVPMHRGIVGTQKINQDLQALLNPQNTPPLIHGSTSYKRGDRVMQIKNNYDKGVFNGDIGTIEQLDAQERLVTVLFDNRPVTYEHDELDELVLAYAISIHKSQGSEYAAAIIPLFTQHFTLLQRNLVYTAITRAKKLCILIGQPKALAIALKNNKAMVRKTYLKEFLTTDLQCR